MQTQKLAQERPYIGFCLLQPTCENWSCQQSIAAQHLQTELLPAPLMTCWPIWNNLGGTERTQPLPSPLLNPLYQTRVRSCPLTPFPRAGAHQSVPSVPSHTPARAAAKLGLPKPLVPFKAPWHRHLAYCGQKAHLFPPQEKTHPPPSPNSSSLMLGREHPLGSSSPSAGSSDGKLSRPHFGMQPSFWGAEMAPAAVWAGERGLQGAPATSKLLQPPRSESSLKSCLEMIVVHKMFQ